MTVLTDARPHATAAKAAIAAALGSSHVYDHGQVPGTYGSTAPLPNIFVLVAVERRASPVLRSARAGNVGWRLVVTALGRTVSESAWAAEKVALALNEQRLTVGGAETTRIQFESATAPRYDDGRFAANLFYTYAH